MTEYVAVLNMIADLADLRAENAKLRSFFRWAVDSVFDGLDVEGGEIQDKALELGLLVEVPGGFDPEKHEDASGCADPGDPWYVLAALGEEASGAEPIEPEDEKFEGRPAHGG